MSRNIIKSIKNFWYQISFHLPYFNTKRANEINDYFEHDGTGDETFLLQNVNMPGMCVFISEADLLCRGEFLFVNGLTEAIARRSVERSLELVKTYEGFIAKAREGHLYTPRNVGSDEMPDLYFRIENANYKP